MAYGILPVLPDAQSLPPRESANCSRKNARKHSGGDCESGLLPSTDSCAVKYASYVGNNQLDLIRSRLAQHELYPMVLLLASVRCCWVRSPDVCAVLLTSVILHINKRTLRIDLMFPVQRRRDVNVARCWAGGRKRIRDCCLLSCLVLT